MGSGTLQKTVVGKHSLFADDDNEIFRWSSVTHYGDDRRSEVPLGKLCTEPQQTIAGHCKYAASGLDFQNKACGRVQFG